MSIQMHRRRVLQDLVVGHLPLPKGELASQEDRQEGRQGRFRSELRLDRHLFSIRCMLVFINWELHRVRHVQWHHRKY
jgi:hypothetical protein